MLFNSKKFKKVLVRREQGLSPLLEFILFTILAALGVAAAFYEFSTGNQGQKTDDLLTEVGQIEATVTNVESGQVGYNGLTTTSVASTGQINAQFLTGTAPNYTGISSPFNSTITVVAGTPVAGVSPTWVLTVPGLPIAACEKAAESNYGPAFVSLTINATAIAAGESAASPTEAATDCNVTGSGSTGNKLIWTFQ
jgi:hypothetical protein